MHLTQVSVEAVEDMFEEAVSAARLVTDAEVELIAYCCTAGTLFKGSKYNERVIRELGDATGRSVITAMGSAVKAIRELDMNSVVVVSPYPEEFDELEVKYLNESGFDVVNTKGMGIRDPIGLAKPTPEEIYKVAKEAWDETANGLFISCLNFRAQSIIDALEADIKKPVVTAIQATLWNCLRTAGINQSICGCGRLLREY
jgi:maleate isomerase